MEGASGLYTGDWKDGKPNGYGAFVFDSAYVSMGFPTNGEGDWVNGNLHGAGIAHWDDGWSYWGEFNNNKKHGYGIMYYLGVAIYDAYWINDIEQ
jgi:hypothetical protein